MNLRNKKISGWLLEQKLGDGGNAEVWSAKSGSERAAVKILTKPGTTSRDRFLYEIKLMKTNQDVVGILPILESGACEIDDTQTLWYVMPVAVPVEEWLRPGDHEQAVRFVAELAGTLGQLHSRGVSHRDIKPKNIYSLNGRPFIGDFGLADDPEKPDHTHTGERLGARWTLAPEMERAATSADGCPADVYSLAKTLWILLTRNPTGFEGQYSHTDPMISLPTLLTEPSLYLLDSLLAESTAHAPHIRPTMSIFRMGLTRWLSTTNNFYDHSVSNWRQLQERLFPTGIPKSAEWTDADVIMKVLNIVGRSGSLNHMFFPDGGGLDLHGAGPAPEEGCILLDAKAKYVVKPRALYFESFAGFEDWAYFLLVADELRPTSVYEQHPRSFETLIELTPGQYISTDGWDDGYVYVEGKQMEAPPSARQIGRYFKGSFLIVAKASLYNEFDDYSGKHNWYSPANFRKEIDELLETHGEKMRDVAKLMQERSNEFHT